MAVDVLEGLLEEDDEVVQVSGDHATVIGPVRGSVTFFRSRGAACLPVCVCEAIPNILVSLFFPFYGSVC